MQPVSAPTSAIAARYSSKWLSALPSGITSLSSPSTISLISRAARGLAGGVQGRLRQVRSRCSLFSSDRKSHTANTCHSMKRRTSSTPRREAKTGCRVRLPCSSAMAARRASSSSVKLYSPRQPPDRGDIFFLADLGVQIGHQAVLQGITPSMDGEVCALFPRFLHEGIGRDILDLADHVQFAQ